MSSDPRPSRSALLVATALALANGGWAAFLWQQLWVARAGGDPFCALGGEGCAALWDGAFASAIHAGTGLPVAAWGVVWSAASLFGVARTLWLARAGRPVEPAWSATAWLAAGGVGTVVLLLVASLAAGEFCSNCAITYVAVAAFATAVFVASATRRPAAWRRGAALALAAVVVAFGLLLYPGLATPKAGAQLGSEVIAGAGAPQRGDALERLRVLIAGMSPQDRQQLANARAAYVAAEPLRPRRPRTLVGARNAPVRLTTFTDSGCGHCAVFHRALDELLEAVPPGSLAIEQRVFPLDGSCNSLVRATGRDFLCLAARVRLCLEDDPRAFALAGWLHEDAEPLEAASIYRVAERLAPRRELEACVASEETTARLREDIAYALEGGITGTPFVLLNGVPSAAYVPFLYAMAVTEGDVDHPVFADLPEPRATDPHAGHDH